MRKFIKHNIALCLIFFFGILGTILMTVIDPGIASAPIPLRLTYIFCGMILFGCTGGLIQAPINFCRGL